MFCAKCGSNIEEGIAFCPMCGNKTGKTLTKSNNYNMQKMPLNGVEGIGSFSNTGMMPTATGESDKKKVPKKAIISCSIAAAVVIILGLCVGLFMKFGTQKNTSIVGQWRSNDIADIGSFVSEMLQEEEGLDGWQADAVVELIGLTTGKLTLTFTDSGRIRVGMGNISLGVGKFTYEDLGNGRIMLDFDISDLEILGNKLPISVSYTSKYSIKNDVLTLDFFGYEAEFERFDDD